MKPVEHWEKIFTKCLPTLHALIGCDTTSKVSTKLAALKAIQKPKNSLLNVNPWLTENTVQMAETFLVRCLKPSTYHKTFDDLQLAAFNTNALILILRKHLALQKMQENTSRDPITNSSCGSRFHFVMLAQF